MAQVSFFSSVLGEPPAMRRTVDDANLKRRAATATLELFGEKLQTLFQDSLQSLRV